MVHTNLVRRSTQLNKKQKQQEISIMKIDRISYKRVLGANSKDLTGQIFGYLTVVSYFGTHDKRGNFWNCRCICGKEVRLATGSLTARRGKVGCGCQWMPPNTTHDMSKTKIYRRYLTMKTRCYNPKASQYQDYGGRGIRVCDRWKNSFEAFYEDMYKTFQDGMTLERIDLNGDYEPSNVKWATKDEQARNKRNNIWLEKDGRRMVVTDWARELGTYKEFILRRLKKGIPFSEIHDLLINKQKP